MSVTIAVSTMPFNPLETLAQHQERLQDRLGKYGATAVFIGTMRDFNDGAAVRAMTLEHYPGMTERQLQCLVEAVERDQPLLDVLVVHRVGELQPGDPIVLVAVWSVHRAAAFAGCRDIVEALKAQAPFWKQEVLPDGRRWVEHNTPG